MPLGEMHGIGPGCRRDRRPARQFHVKVGQELLGRVVDGLGNPLDGRGDAPDGRCARDDRSGPPTRWSARAIKERVSLGVRALDALVPCGRGQRLGIFAGSGVGKSSLLGMIARSTSADVNVICLVGERGREVREFIDRDLGAALARSVVDRGDLGPARARAHQGRASPRRPSPSTSATRGANVMLMMDSVTRFAMAQREVGLAIGEPPATRGYTPSVFALLPKLLERTRHQPQRLDHRPLHGARRRRRHERADRRRRPLDPRRPHRAHARARARRPLPGRRRAAERVAPGGRGGHVRRFSQRAWRCAA